MIKLRINEKCINRISYFCDPQTIAHRSRGLTLGEKMEIEEKLSDLKMEIIWE